MQIIDLDSKQKSTLALSKIPSGFSKLVSIIKKRYFFIIIFILIFVALTLTILLIYLVGSKDNNDKF